MQYSERENQIVENALNRRHFRLNDIPSHELESFSINEHIAHKENSVTHLIGDTHACISCYQTISNPVCERCYLKHLSLWVNDHINDKHLRKEIMNKAAKRVKSESLNEDQCIICGNEAVSLCTYCFFFVIEKILEKSRVSKGVIADFGETFNYKLYHIRYY